MNVGQLSEEIVTRTIRSHQFWLTLGYFAVLFLLAQAYA
jgi:hypothetical protein